MEKYLLSYSFSTRRPNTKTEYLSTTLCCKFVLLSNEQVGIAEKKKHSNFKHNC